MSNEITDEEIIKFCIAGSIGPDNQMTKAAKWVRDFYEKALAEERKRHEKGLKLLRDLADLQNGAPLITYEKEWTETMNEIYTFLKENEPPKNY